MHFWAVIIKTTCPYTNYVKNKTKMFIFNLFSSAFLIFNFLRFLPCILLQRLFYYGSEAIEWFILLNYCVNPFDFSLETYLDLVLTQKNRTKLSFIQCTVGGWCKNRTKTADNWLSPSLKGKQVDHWFRAKICLDRCSTPMRLIQSVVVLMEEM